MARGRIQKPEIGSQKAEAERYSGSGGSLIGPEARRYNRKPAAKLTVLLGGVSGFSSPSSGTR